MSNYSNSHRPGRPRKSERKRISGLCIGFNLNDEYRYKLDAIVSLTGEHKARLFRRLIDAELERLIVEKNDRAEAIKRETPRRQNSGVKSVERRHALQSRKHTPTKTHYSYADLDSLADSFSDLDLNLPDFDYNVPDVDFPTFDD